MEKEKISNSKFGMTWPGFEPTVYCSLDELANHYTIDNETYIICISLNHTYEYYSYEDWSVFPIPNRVACIKLNYIPYIGLINQLNVSLTVFFINLSPLPWQLENNFAGKHLHCLSYLGNQVRQKNLFHLNYRTTLSKGWENDVHFVLDHFVVL
jgi:hypothetical protein